MFKKFAAILTVLIVSLLLPLGVVHAQDTSGNQYLYTTTDSLGTTTTTTTTAAQDAVTSAAALIFSGVFIMIFLFVGLVAYVYGGLTLMAIAQKLNVENAWLAWIPIGNLFLMAKCAGLSAWSALLLFVPFVGFFYIIYVYMKISERRGYNQWLGLISLVPVVGFIWLGVLAWAKSPSDGTATVATAV